jgi:anti-anti-sigma factor
MSTTVTDYGPVTVLTIKEELVGEAVEDFSGSASRCLDKHKYNIVLDCSSLGGLDSTGLEALVDLQEKCEEECGSVRLCGLDETCSKILEITRLARRFEIFENLESAVKSFA